MKKILLLIIILFIWYLILVFKAPSIAKSIENIFWIEWLWTKIIIIETNYNYFSQENIKDTFINWINKTKDKIDDFRLTLSWAENKYNNTKKIINESLDKIDKTKDVIQDIQEIISSWSTSLN